MRVKSAAIESVNPMEVAKLIGLNDAGILGTEPISLPVKTLARLREHGSLTELSTTEAGAIMRITRYECHARTKTERTYRQDGQVRTASRAVVLGHRQTSGGQIMISAAALAAYLTATASAPVPTTGAAPAVSAKAAEAKARKAHNLPKRSA